MKMFSVAGFINELQESLSDNAFQRFKTALGVYKKVSILSEAIVCNNNSICCMSFVCFRNKRFMSSLKV